MNEFIKNEKKNLFLLKVDGEKGLLKQINTYKYTFH